MDLSIARSIAQEVVTKLEPYCERVEVVGSVRRRKQFPRDIDILLIPRNQGQLALALYNLGGPRLGGKKLEERIYNGVQVDFYFATPETWFTLLLIRTGSKEHNIKLVTRAKHRGWHLFANGKGLFNKNGERVAGDSEGSFFTALGLPYVEPWQR